MLQMCTLYSEHSYFVWDQKEGWGRFDMWKWQSLWRSGRRVWATFLSGPGSIVFWVLFDPPPNSSLQRYGECCKYVCPSSPQTYHLYTFNTSSLFRLLSTPELLSSSTSSRFRNELHSNAPTMGGDGDHHADQHHGLPHQHLLLLRRPLRRQVLWRRRDRVRSPHPSQPPHTPTIYACCGFCGREVRTEGIIFEFEFRIRIKVFFFWFQLGGFCGQSQFAFETFFSLYF